MFNSYVYIKMACRVSGQISDGEGPEAGMYDWFCEVAE